MSEEQIEETQDKRIRHTILVALIVFGVPAIYLWKEDPTTFQFKYGSIFIFLIALTAGFYSSYHPEKTKGESPQ